MKTITVIGRDRGNERHGYEGVLIYAVKVPDLEMETALAAFIDTRQEDLGPMSEEEKEDCEVLFAFESDLPTVADWRE